MTEATQAVGAVASSTTSRGIELLGRRYLESLRVRGYAEESLKNKRAFLDRFARWCADRGVEDAGDVTKAMIERYRQWLFYYRKKNGKPMVNRSQYSHVVLVRGLFRWLSQQSVILTNPAAELDMPRVDKTLPRHVLTLREVESLLGQPEVTEPLGLRDRAIMETLYSTGMRRAEVVHLGLHDVSWDRGTILIRQGKGHKDRVVPIGERALGWLRKYVEEVRPRFVVEPDGGILFLNVQGGMLGPKHLSRVVGRYVEQSKLGKVGSCHLLRHTMATLMLENGADVRYIQAILGHVELSTTEVYTHVSIRKLKEVHAATHPGSATRKARPAEAEVSADSLLGALEAEAAEEKTVSDAAADASDEELSP